MRRAPGASRPKPSSCRRSQFPHGPWRWPDGHHWRSFLPRSPLRLHPHTPPRAIKEGRSSPSDRPFLWPKEKAAECPPPKILAAQEALALLGAELGVAAAAAFLAGGAQGGADRRHVAGPGGGRQLVVKRVGILARRGEARGIAPDRRQGLGVGALVGARREHLVECV